MSGMLPDLSSPDQVIEAIEGNNREHFRYLCRMPQTEWYEEPDTISFLTGAPIRWFNGVIQTNIVTRNVDTVISECLARFAAREIPMLWWCGPTTHPADLGAHLLRHELTHLADFPGMAIDLALLEQDNTPQSGLTIEPVRDADTFEQWLTTLMTGFGFEESLRTFAFDIFQRVGVGDELPLRHYLGSVQGEPVAASSVFLGASVAGINYVATVPSARGRGIGRRMTLAPLLDARDRGYRIGVLEATEMGLPVYRRLGFREYCKHTLYTWPPLGGEA